MTSLEKLAMDACLDGANPMLAACDNFENGFEAGFKAARLMAVKLLEEQARLVQNHPDFVFDGHYVTYHLPKAIARFGEE